MLFKIFKIVPMNLNIFQGCCTFNDYLVKFIVILLKE